MSLAANLPNQLPRHLRPKREKVYGPAQGIPLDRNAKARIMVYARSWSAQHKRPGQHRGPLTRAFMEVLAAMLWGFHNSRDGRCMPSYETIAAKAECNRDTVYEAIKALEAADVLNWVNRIVRIATRERDLFGNWVNRWRIIRTSNAYTFRDPLPCHAGRPDNSETYALGSSKSENPSGTLNQEFSLFRGEIKDPPPPLGEALQEALARLGNAIAAKIEKEAAMSAA
jgi:hypothetical protein